MHRISLLALAAWAIVLSTCNSHPAFAEFRCGAYAADITPEAFPVTVNGGFLPDVVKAANSKLHARCLVMDDGKTKIAMVVVDSCVLPQEMIADIKRQASKTTGIPADHMCISATHTHSAPALMSVLGCDEDANYHKLFIPRVIDGIERAAKNLTPVKVGWAVVKDWQDTHCRQWIYRPDRMLSDPFGQPTVRINMHPGYVNASTISPSGPVDPDLSILSFMGLDGKPVAVLANYSMHYFGAPAVSSDYYGLFCDKLAKRISPNNAAFMAAMSQGTSGDLHWMDYGKPAQKVTLESYSESLAEKAYEAFQKIKYQDSTDLAMAEKDLHLRVREPDDARLTWARDVMGKINGKPIANMEHVYAREAILLHENPIRDVKVQAIRIGDLGIGTLSDEVFGITGLKIKAQSPLAHTFNLELANAENGYIPPPEFHPLGGYTTWPARSACLEVTAEPKIVEAVLGLLEQVSGQPRKKITESNGAYPQAVLASKPVAYWRFNQLAGQSLDSTGGNHTATHEKGVLFGLEGPESDAFSGAGVINRATHHAGGRTLAELKEISGMYSVEFWFWNGLPPEARAVTGYLVSRGLDGDKEAPGDHLGIGGTFASPGSLIFFNGNKLGTVVSGNTKIPLKTWNHVVYVRDGKRVLVYLNGNASPEIEGEADSSCPDDVKQFFFGGRSDGLFGLEGRMDEVAVYNRVVTADEAVAHYKITGLPPRANATAPLAEGPKSPAEGQKLIHVKEGFTLEQMAAEPLTIDPVAMAWGPDGKLWIAEMSDYPYGVDGKMKAGSRIRYLEDTDGDGKYDKSVLFMENVNFPTGVLPWKKGVIVTAAPDIFYAEDTNGDGKADKREVLYTGFTQGNPQLRVNGLQWGLDNWVYCANGWSSQGEVTATRTGKKVGVGGRDIRLKIDEGDIDTDTGMTEFGRNRDEYGEWFGCNNSEPLWHYVLSDRYTRRNPYVAPPELRYQLARPNNPKVYPLSRPEKRYHSFEQAGHFTSACATIFYRDNLLFETKPGEHHAFVCEPVHNLVQHLVVKDDGVSFTAGRAPDEPDSEFLAAEDTWCRPVFLATGPDGALWVCDMYRQMVEHPDWLPPVGQQELKPFYRKGDDMGRIYRMYPKGKQPRAIPRMDKMTDDQLVAALDSPSTWQRDMAQMMLLWRNEPKTKEAPKSLVSLISESKNPLARMHALCTLDGLGHLDTPVLLRAMADEHWAVRRQAVRISEARASKEPQVITAAVKLAEDPDARVRFQLACALGEWKHPAAGEALAKLAVKDAADTYISAAVMSSASTHYEMIAAAVLKSHEQLGGPLYRNLLAMSLALNNRNLTASLLKPVIAPQSGQYSAAQMTTLAQWLDTLALARTSIQQLAAGPKDDLTSELANATKLLDTAQAMAGDAKTTPESRIAAIGLLGREPARATGDLDRIASLLTPQTPTDLQQAAVGAARRIDNPRTPQVLLAGWEGHSPAIRQAIAEVMIPREPWAFTLMESIQQKKLAALDLNLAHRQRLLNHESGRVKQLSQALLADPAGAENRQKVIDRYAPVPDLTGDVSRGEKVFTQNCAVCHRFDNVGSEIGPNLRTVSKWNVDQVLAAVLDPNRQVEPRFLSYNAKLKDGNTLFGVIVSETSNSIILKGVDGKAVTLLRTDLVALTCTNRSLMPEGFESAVNQKAMADLVAFLKQPVK